MSKSDVFLIISQIYIVAYNRDNKVLIGLMSWVWLILSYIVWVKY